MDFSHTAESPFQGWIDVAFLAINRPAVLISYSPGSRGASQLS